MFFFRTVPLELIRVQIMQLQSVVDRFIWGWKKTRSAPKYMTLLLTHGGWGGANFSFLLFSLSYAEHAVSGDRGESKVI